MDVQIQELVSTLSKLNNNMDNVVDSLRKLEQNEVESIKAMYDLKISLLKDASDSANALEDIERITETLNNKFNEEISSVKTTIADIKNYIERTLDSKLNNINNMPDCLKCVALNSEKNLSKRLWWIVLVLTLSIMAILGFNLFGVISIPLP